MADEFKWKIVKFRFGVTREEHPVLKFLDIATKIRAHEQTHLFETEKEVLQNPEEPLSSISTYVGISKWNFVFSVSPICLMIDESKNALRVWKKCATAIIFKLCNLDPKPEFYQSDIDDMKKADYYMYRKDVDGEFYECKKGKKEKPLPNGMSDVIRIAGYASDKVRLKAEVDEHSYVYDYVYEYENGEPNYVYKIKLKRTVYTVYFGCEELYMKFTEFKYGGHENCKLCYGEYSSPFHNTVPQAYNFATYMSKVERNLNKHIKEFDAASQSRSRKVEDTILGSVINMTSILKDDRSKNAHVNAAVYKRLEKEGYKNRHNHPNILITHQSEDDYYYRYGSEDFGHILSEFLPTLTLMETKMKEKFVRNIVEGFVALHKHKPKRKHVNLTKDNVKICKDSSVIPYIAKVEDESLLCRKKIDSKELGKDEVIPTPNEADSKESVKDEVKPNEAGPSKLPILPTLEDTSVEDEPYEFEFDPYEEKSFQEELKALGKVCFFALTGCELVELRNGGCSDVDIDKLSKYPEAQDLICKVLVPSKSKGTKFEEVEAHPFRFEPHKVTDFFRENRHYLGEIVKTDTKLHNEIEELLTDSLGTEVLLKVIEDRSVEAIKKLSSKAAEEKKKATAVITKVIEQLKKVITKFWNNTNVSSEVKTAINNLKDVNVASILEVQSKKTKELLAYSNGTGAVTDEDFKELCKVIADFTEVSKKLSNETHVSSKVTRAINNLNTVNVASISKQQLKQMEELLTYIAEQAEQAEQANVLLKDIENRLKGIETLPKVDEESLKAKEDAKSKVIAELEKLKTYLQTVANESHIASKKLKEVKSLSSKELEQLKKMAKVLTRYHGPEVLLKEIMEIWEVIHDKSLEMTIESSEAKEELITVLSEVEKVLTEVNRVSVKVKKVLLTAIKGLNKMDATFLPKEQVDRLKGMRDIVDKPATSLVTNVRNIISHTKVTLESEEIVRKEYPTLLISLYNVMKDKCKDTRINESYFKWNGEEEGSAEPQEGSTTDPPQSQEESAKPQKESAKPQEKSTESPEELYEGQEKGMEEI
ncbi:uncharacterized protein [Rutidosis leptorrhynchoides]|uniref:uncharacterized protein isoform X2 n=1 Tax=Rutidosis leptorrhynchoides TaxID=125765 RepID=UPI003A9A537A